MSNDSKNFIPINLILFLKEKNYNYDIFIKINEQYIKIAHKELVEHADLKKYLLKGISQIFLTEDGYQEYIENKLAIIKNLHAPKTEQSLVEIMDQLADNTDLMNELFKSTGCDETKLELAHSISQEVLDIIDKKKDFKDLFNVFKTKSKHDFVRKTFICVISAYMLRIQETIDQKMLQSYCCAVLLSDIFLSESEIKQSYTTYENIFLNKKILYHGENLLDKMPSDSLLGSSIFTNIIKFHHELPDGSGYPNRMKYTRFDLWLCTYFIADLYFSLMKKNEFRLDNKKDVIVAVNEECKKYRTQHFRKALSNFNKAFNPEETQDE